MVSRSLPSEVEQVNREFRTCEFATLSEDGTPITWPTIPFYDPQRRAVRGSAGGAMAISLSQRPRSS